MPAKHCSEITAVNTRNSRQRAVIRSTFVFVPPESGLIKITGISAKISADDPAISIQPNI